MRDRGRFWPPQPVHGANPAACLWLVSGALTAFPGGLAVHGPRDICPSVDYALRLAPDRVLAVFSKPRAAPEGWSAAGYGVSDVSDGYRLIDIADRAIIAAGTAYDFTDPAPRPWESAAMLFAGLPVAVLRRPDGIRLHIERPLASALQLWIERVTGDLST